MLTLYHAAAAADMAVIGLNRAPILRAVHSPAAILLAAALLFLAQVWLRFPGETSPDSDHQYRELLSGVFDDWHPPVMARIWQLLAGFVPGPGPMFVFDLMIYWSTFALVAAGCMWLGRPRAGWTFLALALFPTFLMMNINIAKDVTLMLVLLAAAVLFAVRCAGLKLGWIYVASGIVLLGIGVLVRNNAVFLAGPLAAYIAHPALLRRPMALMAGSVVLGLVLVPVTTSINRNVLMARDAGAIRSLELFDLAGIASITGDVGVFGPQSRITSTDVARCYSPIEWDPMGWDHRCGWFMRQIGLTPEFGLLVDNADDRAAIGRLGALWRQAILSHPIAYLEHRLASFNSATFFIQPWRHTAGEVKLPPIRPGLGGRLAESLRFSPLTAPAVVLALALALIVHLAAAHRNWTEASALAMAFALATLLYGASFLVVGVASEIRYFFVPTVSCAVALLLALSDAVRPTLGSDLPVRRARWRVMALPLAVLAVTIGARFALPSPVPRSGEQTPVIPEAGRSPFPATPTET